MNYLINKNNLKKIFSAGEKVKNTTTEKFVTTKELAEELHVSVPIIRNIAKELFNPEKALFRVVNGGKSLVFNYEQATAIKLKLRTRNNLKETFLAREKVMTVREVAEAMGVSYDTVNNSVKRLFPQAVKNGVKTFLNEEQVACISKELKNNTDVQKQIDKQDNFMTIRNIADIFNISYSSVYRVIEKLFPNKMKNGEVTKLNEKEVALISKELKGDYHIAQKTFSAGEKVKNTTTELEVLSNALSAFNALQDLYNQKEAEYKNIIAEKQAILDRITNGKGCYSMSQTAKALKLPYGNITLFEKLRSMQILNLDNTPKQEQINNGNFKIVVKYINEKVGNKTVTLTTGKGLVYLAKKFNTEIDESVKADA